MYVIVVDFTIRPERVSEFREAMERQARNSLEREAGCRQFEVAVDPDRRGRFFLYEVYDDEAAFRLHLESEHFRAFDAQVRDWTQTKSVTALERIFPAE